VPNAPYGVCTVTHSYRADRPDARQTMFVSTGQHSLGVSSPLACVSRAAALSYRGLLGCARAMLPSASRIELQPYDRAVFSLPALDGACATHRFFYKFGARYIQVRM
jgi:hypothetical protein